MKGDKSERELHLQHVLQEIGDALKRCESETSCLEDALSTWAMAQEDTHNFPSMQLQRLDYLKQMQADLSVTVHNVASHLTNSSSSRLVMERTDLLLGIKLSEVKDRLSNTALRVALSNNNSSSSADDNSDVHLFLES